MLIRKRSIESTFSETQMYIDNILRECNIPEISSNDKVYIINPQEENTSPLTNSTSESMVDYSFLSFSSI